MLLGSVSNLLVCVQLCSIPFRAHKEVCCSAAILYWPSPWGLLGSNTLSVPASQWAGECKSIGGQYQSVTGSQSQHLNHSHSLHSLNL